MPTTAVVLATRTDLTSNMIRDFTGLVKRGLEDHELLHEKRFYLPCCNSSSPPGLVQAETEAPWQQSGTYALYWTYFCAALLVVASFTRFYTLWTDSIKPTVPRRGLTLTNKTLSPDTDHELSAVESGTSTKKFFPRDGTLPSQPTPKRSTSTSWPVNATIALWRRITYRPLPVLQVRQQWCQLSLPSIGVLMVVSAATAFVICYCFIPQPLFFESITYGSPPLAIRAGMIGIAMIPWIVALGTKANFISFVTGLEHRRLNVLHRWATYICLLLALVHMVPFYIARMREPDGYATFESFFAAQHVHIMSTGIAALVPLLFLCIISLPPLRRRFYETVALLQAPVIIVFVGMLFWHCHNYLSSWIYLFAAVAIWGLSYVFRIRQLNWTNPFSKSWLVGEEAAVTLLPERAVKVLVPTKKQWKPGQHIYLRMPGIAVLENHPFTIVSPCNDNEPSALGKEFHDLTLVFRPLKGFTSKVVETALDFGPWHTYRAFLDGPYGGMQRKPETFDHVVFFAGGIGIASIMPNLVDLVKRMREGTASTKTVHLVWVMKRAESIEWFEEELQKCRDTAPAGTFRCEFYVTSAKRQLLTGGLVDIQSPLSTSGLMISGGRTDVHRDLANNKFGAAEDDDCLEPLPQAHLRPIGNVTSVRAFDDVASTETSPSQPTLHEKRRARALTLDIHSTQHNSPSKPQQQMATMQNPQQFDFGFPSTPSDFQKNLMRFAFMPAAVKSHQSGWSTEWGRPSVAHMLQDMSREWMGRRVCVSVCGPTSMRVDVSNAVAGMQTMVLRGKQDEIFLHTEDYAV